MIFPNLLVVDVSCYYLTLRDSECEESGRLMEKCLLLVVVDLSPLVMAIWSE